jgi:stage II sporulation protein E
MAFSGPGCKYYVLLCDGMGTGIGAAEDGSTVAGLLRRMLTAGFPPEHAFRSINSLLALRGQAGAATLDLAEIRLDSGRIALYKWGAAPSWVLRKKGAEKIGTATPPPGISVTEGRETVTRLSLGRGEVLILLSDGVEVGEILRRKGMAPDAPPGELAERLLELGCRDTADDATAAVIRLHPLKLYA